MVFYRIFGSTSIEIRRRRGFKETLLADNSEGRKNIPHYLFVDFNWLLNIVEIVEDKNIYNVGTKNLFRSSLKGTNNLKNARKTKILSK